MTRAGTLSFVILLAAASGAAAGALTREQALAAAFPGAAIRTEQVFLTAAQQQEATRIAGAAVASPLVARYMVTSSDGRPLGTAYVDTHVVRTKKETLLISLDSAARVKRVDVIVFDEPAEYRSPDAWSRQYAEQSLSDDLQVNRAIRPLAGATLTARAINAAVRRVLAIDQVLRQARSAAR